MRNIKLEMNIEEMSALRSALTQQEALLADLANKCEKGNENRTFFVDEIAICKSLRERLHDAFINRYER